MQNAGEPWPFLGISQLPSCDDPADGIAYPANQLAAARASVPVSQEDFFPPDPNLPGAPSAASPLAAAAAAAAALAAGLAAAAL